MEFCVLSSGSKANCIYLAGSSTKILIDCGLSCREVERRLSLVEREAKGISAVLVTHEHRDHISGVPTFCRKHRAAAYTNVGELTRRFSDLGLKDVSEFSAGTDFSIGEFEIHPFSVTHDAADPVGFRISAAGCSVAVITDLGQLTMLVREKTRGLSAIVLESNHDLDLLHEAPYPWVLKQRIKSNDGHLSNEAAALLIEELSFRNEPLQVIVAAHISENSNVPELALESFQRAWEKGRAAFSPQIVAASAYHPTPLFKLSALPAAAVCSADAERLTAAVS